jgi:hypothetical protein
LLFDKDRKDDAASKDDSKKTEILKLLLEKDSTDGSKKIGANAIDDKALVELLTYKVGYIVYSLGYMEVHISLKPD